MVIFAVGTTANSVKLSLAAALDAFRFCFYVSTGPLRPIKTIRSMPYPVQGPAEHSDSGSQPQRITLSSFSNHPRSGDSLQHRKREKKNTYIGNGMRHVVS